MPTSYDDAVYDCNFCFVLNQAKYDSNLKSKVLPTHIDDFTDNGSHDSRKQHIMINSSDVTNSNHRRIPMKII